MAFFTLTLAIISEVFGSAMLKLSDGFKRKAPLPGFIIGFGLAFYLLGIALTVLPLGFAYALWSGAGTILTVIIGGLFFNEKIKSQAVIGILFILVGMIFLNIF